MFCAGNDETIVDSKDSVLHLYKTDDLLTHGGWQAVQNLNVGDMIVSEDGINARITRLEMSGNFIDVYFDSDISKG